MLRHIFQSCILESHEEILELIQKVYSAFFSSKLQTSANAAQASAAQVSAQLCECTSVQVWMELLFQAPQQYVVAASCPWMGAWLCLMMQASHIPIDQNMLLEVKARSKVPSLFKSGLVRVPLPSFFYMF